MTETSGRDVESLPDEHPTMGELAHRLERIEGKLDSLLADSAFVKENAPKIAASIQSELQQKLGGTLLGKLILGSVSKSE